MPRLNRHIIVLLGMTALVVALACSVSLGPSTSLPQPPTFDSTRAALEAQGTALALQLTQSALNVQPPLQPPPVVPIDSPIPPPQPTPTQDLAARMRNANILVYEDAQNAALKPWVKATLNRMGLNYTWDGDAQGYFMEHLNSGTTWDLIIIAAESRSGVQGEFWDVIMPKINRDKTALILELWYLSDTASGRISALTGQCGVRFQKVRSEVDSIYTLDSSHPVFTTPNSNFGLTHYLGYWTDKGGDYLRVTGGDAKLLAGGFPGNKSDYGLIATCIEGRVIIQTFSDHDYHQEDIMELWENYITWVLGNRFAQVP